MKTNSERALSRKLQQGGVTLLQSEKVPSLVVGRAVHPAAVQDADPLEGERAQGRLVAHAAGPAALVEGLRPEGAREGLWDPFHEGLAQKGRAGPAPVDPGLVAASFGDGSDARVLLQRGGVGKARAARRRRRPAWAPRLRQRQGGAERARSRAVPDRDGRSPRRSVLWLWKWLKRASTCKRRGRRMASSAVRGCSERMASMRR